MKISTLTFRLLVVIICFSNYYAFGVVSPSFKGFTKADGLSDLLVNVMYQDSTGFMWLGTGKGLDRFDGVRIKHYPFEKSLQGQRIRINAICETANGQMWVGNALGLWRLDEKTGTLSRVFAEKVNHAVNALFFDGNKKLYIGTERGLYVYDGVDIRQIDVAEHSLSSSNSIRAIARGGNGVYWLATTNSVISFDSENEKIAEYVHPATSREQVNFRCLTVLADRLYLGSYNAGIICFDSDTHTFSDFVDVGSDIISSISTDGNDLIYVSTDGNGVFFLSHKEKKIVRSFRHDVDNPTSIRSNSVYSLLVDSVGRIWIGYYQDGFDYSLYQSGLFKVYSLPADFSSLNLTVRSFFIHDKEKLIGTRDGLYFIDERNGRVQYFNRADLQSDLILSIIYYRDEYYVGTYGAGIYILNPRTLQLRRFKPEGKDIFRKGQVFCLRTDSQNRLWMGTSEGVARYDGATDDVTLYSNVNSPLPEGNVYEVFFDSEQKGWLCTDKGLALYDPQTESIRTNLFPQNFFNNEKIHVMYEDSRRQLYFLPEKGDIFTSDLSMKSFSRMNKLPALQANIYTSITEDEKGCLWLTSDGGLVRFCGDEYTVFNFKYGIPSPIFTHSSAYQDEDGVLWFGNTRGLLSVNPEEINDLEEDVSRLTVSDLLVNGNSLPLHDLKQVIQSGHISFKSDQNNLGFRLTDFSYTDPSAILIEYKMEGVDADWKFATGQDEINYFNLPSGKHHFRMRVPGKENTETGVIVTIQKSLYEARFILYLLLLVVALSLFIYLFMTRKNKLLIREKNRIINEEKEHGMTEGVDAKHKDDEKYKMNRLSEQECLALSNQLNCYMEEAKPYKNKDLKIGDLADALGVPSASLSYLLNQYLNVSYYDFINEWRIREFKKLVAEDISQRYTLNALAELCGFSSRASFFRSFKKNMGITPNEYIKSLKE